MPTKDRLRKCFAPLLLFSIFLTYFILRLGWTETIEFGFDQPQLAEIIQDYLHRGTYITMQQFSQLTPWGYLSWGPSATFLFSLFFRFSGNPIVVSQIIAVFNFLSVIMVFYIGWRFYNFYVGAIAGFFLATHPWWIVFSRMIYTPSPIPSLVSVAMLLTFLIFEKKSTYVWSMLIFLWGILIQIYISTASIILSSAVASLIYMRKQILSRFTLLGIFLLIILFIPSINYYSSNSNLFFAFAKVPDKWENKPSVAERFVLVSKAYLSVMSGNGFENQLGYATEEFNSWLAPNVLYGNISRLLLIVVLFSSVIMLFYTQGTERSRLTMLIIWSSAPWWFMIAVHVPYLVPRYFLLGLPALSLLFGVVLMKAITYLRGINYALEIIPVTLYVFMSGWWIIFIISYYSFISHYNYSRGFLSHFSDPPYIFVEQSFNWILDDAHKKGYKKISLGNNRNYPKLFILDNQERYFWNYVAKFPTPQGDENFDGYYFMDWSPFNSSLESSEYAQFGPYFVYALK